MVVDFKTTYSIEGRYVTKSHRPYAPEPNSLPNLKSATLNEVYDAIDFLNSFGCIIGCSFSSSTVIFNYESARDYTRCCSGIDAFYGKMALINLPSIIISFK